MNRAQLEHVIRAAATIAEDQEIVVIGSQAILGRYPDAPDELCVSADVDLYPRNHPDRADLIDGSIGELSPFHDEFGYYAQGVDETTAILPDGWKDRLVLVRNENTRGHSGWCLDPHDLVIAKCIAGREKDVIFLEGAVKGRLVSRETLHTRLAKTTLDDQRRNQVKARIDRAF